MHYVPRGNVRARVPYDNCAVVGVWNVLAFLLGSKHSSSRAKLHTAAFKI